MLAIEAVDVLAISDSSSFMRREYIITCYIDLHTHDHSYGLTPYFYKTITSLTTTLRILVADTPNKYFGDMYV